MKSQQATNYQASTDITTAEFLWPEICMGKGLYKIVQPKAQ